MSEQARTPIGNRILAALSDEDRNQILPHLAPFELKLSDVIGEMGKVMEHVYFINSGMVSLVSHTEEGGTIEVGIIGNEGIVGLSVYLGVDESQYRLLVQGQGDAFRI